MYLYVKDMRRIWRARFKVGKVGIKAGLLYTWHIERFLSRRMYISGNENTVLINGITCISAGITAARPTTRIKSSS
jgi:hypothetical protein